MSQYFFIDIPRMRGFIVVPSSASLVELGVPNLASVLSRGRVAAWRSKQDTWVEHRLEETSQGVQLTFGELRSPQELSRAHRALQHAGIIDEELRSTFEGSTGELLQSLKPVQQKLDLDAAVSEEPLSCFGKFRNKLFAIECENWETVLLFIPERLRPRVRFRPQPLILPFMFTEQRLSL
jgi:hypothetical protein